MIDNERARESLVPRTRLPLSASPCLPLPVSPLSPFPLPSSPCRPLSASPSLPIPASPCLSPRVSLSPRLRESGVRPCFLHGLVLTRRKRPADLHARNNVRP
ncbi:hypothetical protein KAW44_01900, partial [Candidatus Bipolaricaulota bacterium]|nr:hypothetical protein [Candidatus Bipolaricaulota bacterium]